MVLKCLVEHGLKLYLSKCMFFYSQVEYLGAYDLSRRLWCVEKQGVGLEKYTKIKKCKLIKDFFRTSQVLLEVNCKFFYV